uniref:Transposase n=1 Tax=Globodera rostochiensis TaxID=31243 RepID=A0A914H4J7_GLORO
MEEIWILILVSFFATNSLDKAESVRLEELPLQTFDELFVEGWWDNEEAEDLQRPPTIFGQIEHNSTDQNPPPTESDHFGQIEPNLIDQNPPLTESDHFGQIEPNLTDQNPPLTESDHSGQIEPNSTDQNPPPTESDHSGQIEPNSTDQLRQIEPNSTDQLGQIEHNSIDQNPPLIESDHSDNAKNGAEQNEIIKEISSNQNIAEDERKRKIVDKFHAIKDEFKQIGQFSAKEWNQIEDKIANHLKRKAELQRAGLKNSYHHEIDETVAKELGLNFRTIYKWKRKFGQSKPQHKHSHSEQKELMKHYYEIKSKNPKIRNADIAKMLKIGTDTLIRWKKQFKPPQFHPNSVDSVEVNDAATNVQEIGNSNSDRFE